MAKMSQENSVVDVMKSDTLLHKQGFVDSFSQTTVTLLDTPFEPYNNEIPELVV